MGLLSSLGFIVGFEIFNPHISHRHILRDLLSYFLLGLGDIRRYSLLCFGVLKAIKNHPMYSVWYESLGGESLREFLRAWRAQ